MGVAPGQHHRRSCRRNDPAVPGVLDNGRPGRRRGAGAVRPAAADAADRCWPTSSASARSPSPTSRTSSSCWCCCRRARRPAQAIGVANRNTKQDYKGVYLELQPEPQPAATMHHRVPARPPAASRPPTRTTPIGRPAICTAGCRRTRRSTSEAPATRHARRFRASVPRRSRCARATRTTCRSTTASTGRATPTRRCPGQPVPQLPPGSPPAQRPPPPGTGCPRRSRPPSTTQHRYLRRAGRAGVHAIQFGQQPEEEHTWQSMLLPPTGGLSEPDWWISHRCPRRAAERRSHRQRPNETNAAATTRCATDAAATTRTQRREAAQQARTPPRRAAGVVGLVIDRRNVAGSGRLARLSDLSGAPGHRAA